MKTSFYRILLTTCIVLFGVFSCKKETSESEGTPQQQEASLAASESEATAEIIFNDVFDNVIGANSQVGIEGVGVFGRMATTNETTGTQGCYTVAVTQLVQGQFFPLRIVIDFGTAGCTGKDGRTRSGKIITEYAGRLTTPGNTSTTVFENYKVDSLTIEGSYKIANTGNANMRQFTVDVTGARLSKPNNNFIRWNSHKIITQTEGLGTPDIHTDDVFTISGYSSGELSTKTFATAWESNIKEALQKRFTCRWISKGIVEVKRQNLNSDSPWLGNLNYGGGDCDNKAILTVNEITHQITLH